MSTRRGPKREHQVRALFERAGWYVMRSAGSHGPVDILALSAGHDPCMVQVKSSVRSALAGFGPRDRAELREVAQRSGATPLLCWWPPDRQPPRWYYVAESGIEVTESPV